MTGLSGLSSAESFRFVSLAPSQFRTTNGINLAHGRDSGVTSYISFECTNHTSLIPRGESFEKNNLREFGNRRLIGVRWCMLKGLVLRSCKWYLVSQKLTATE